MKKFILLTFSTFLVVYSYCQSEKQVFRLKAFQSVVKTDNDNRTVSDNDWDNADIVVVIEFDKNKIHTYGDKEEDLDLIRKIDSYIDSDNGSSV